MEVLSHSVLWVLRKEELTSHNLILEEKMAMPLVVIDVQEDYYDVRNYPKFVRNVLKHIEKAIENKAPIIVLSYKNQGVNHRDIVRLLENYDNCSFYIKNKSDGSSFVIRSLKKNHNVVASATVRLCGLKTGDCVAATARGLVDKGFKVRVIEEACSSLSSAHNRQVAIWERDKKIKVIFKAADYRH